MFCIEKKGVGKTPEGDGCTCAMLCTSAMGNGHWGCLAKCNGEYKYDFEVYVFMYKNGMFFHCILYNEMLINILNDITAMSCPI